MPKAAVGYLRVSTAEHAAQNDSLRVQEGKIKGYCAANNLVLLSTFSDRQSGPTANNRPEFERMHDFCQKNHKKISHVIVADLARFARNVVDQGSAIMTLKQLGMEVVSIDESNHGRHGGRQAGAEYACVDEPVLF